MISIENSFSSLNFPVTPTGKGKAAGILVEPIPGCDERYCVAVIAILSSRELGAKVTVNPRISKALLGGDLARSLLSLAQLSCQDFLSSKGDSKQLKNWIPPFEGISLTKWRDFNADGVASMLTQAALMFSTLAHSGDPTEVMDSDIRTPQVSEEDNFKLGVKNNVLKAAPELRNNFDNKVSAISGSALSFDVDYLSSSLTACFSTINPRAPRKTLLRRHHSALWRIARTRDFSIYKSSASELIVWKPEPGIPLYSSNDYEIANEITNELTYEAKKEDIRVVTQFREELAAAHLIEHERRLLSVDPLM
jgi:hypothetical protein